MPPGKFCEKVLRHLVDKEGKIFALPRLLFGTPAFQHDGTPYYVEEVSRRGKKSAQRIMQARICLSRVPDHIVLATIYHLVGGRRMAHAKCILFTRDGGFLRDARMALVKEADEVDEEVGKKVYEELTRVVEVVTVPEKQPCAFMIRKLRVSYTEYCRRVSG